MEEQYTQFIIALSLHGTRRSDSRPVYAAHLPAFGSRRQGGGAQPAGQIREFTERNETDDSSARNKGRMAVPSRLRGKAPGRPVRPPASSALRISSASPGTRIPVRMAPARRHIRQHRSVRGIFRGSVQYRRMEFHMHGFRYGEFLRKLDKRKTDVDTRALNEPSAGRYRACTPDIQSTSSPCGKDSGIQLVSSVNTISISL